MNKLIQKLTLGNNEIKLARATGLAARIGAAQVNLINHYRGRLLEVNQKLTELLDLAPTNTQELSVGRANFSPEAFVNTVQDLQTQKLKLLEQIDVAKTTLADWGTENDFTQPEVAAEEGEG